MKAKERIYSQDIGMEFYTEKMCLADNDERKTEGIELPNQEKIRKLGEKETYKYLGILEVDCIKHVKLKEKKNTSGKQENYSKPNCIAEISSKG